MNGDNKLNANSYISFGLMIVVISCSIWITTSFGKIEQRLTRIEDNIWTGSDMLRWATRYQNQNPSAKVPEPKHEPSREVIPNDAY